MRMRRVVVVLVLVLAIPLRALAAVVMPCCPLEEEAVGMHAMDVDHHASDPAPDDGHRHEAAPCFTVAMMVPSLHACALPGVHPPTRTADRADRIMAFLTDAPERPPRLPVASA